MNQISNSPRSVADELRVIRKAIRRIQAHESHAALKALKDVQDLAEEAKSSIIPEEPAPTLVKFQIAQREGWKGFR